MAELNEVPVDDIKIGVPYDGQGAELALDKHVHFPQLADELVKLVGEAVSFVAEGDLSGEKGFLKLHFSDPSVDLAKVKKLVDAHVVNLDHGLSDEVVKLRELKDRLAKADLPVKDLNALLRLHFQ